MNRVTLQEANPELAKQWHPIKNGTLKLADITRGSHKKVWWICNKGHEWQATVCNRSRGDRCPYCSGKKACKENCLAAMSPNLVKQWHPIKNGKLTPRDVTCGSHGKVWWLCDKGHEWQATIYNRNNGSGCPYCHAQISQLELRIYCELKYLFHSTVSKAKIAGGECDVYIPEIEAGVEIDGMYWHHNKYLQDREKTAAIRSKGITLIRVREVGLEIISDTDIFYTQKDGTLTVIRKILRSLNEQCSLNAGKRKAIEKYLQRKMIANDAEYKKLWDILPSPFPGLSLLEQNSDLANQWHPTKNGKLKPSSVPLHSSIKVWWRCGKNKNHEWQATVNDRSKGYGCPYCAGKTTYDGNCLASLNPDLAKEWHPKKNGDLTPADITIGSNRRVWWLCKKGHEWQATVCNRSKSKSTGCPYCAGKTVCNDNCLAVMNPDLAKEWHQTKNDRLTPRDVTLHSGKKVWWQCSRNKNHEWQATVNTRSKGHGCLQCQRLKRSKSV